ncbi:MAG: CPBP family intramembrane metalloprotease [Desulfobacterales bacterium]|nr:CPBP family intramembrane metalloprotease [Desulfobacterales bacterium]
MSGRASGSLLLAATVLLAAGLWFITFALKGPSFWVKISISAATLALLSLLLDPPRRLGGGLEARTWLVGLGSAAALYLIFWIGRTVSLALFDFAGDQIGAIYHKGEGTPAWVIALLLFCVTGPCEEIYWRGYLQRRLMDRFGRWPGWAFATALRGSRELDEFHARRRRGRRRRLLGGALRSGGAACAGDPLARRLEHGDLRRVSAPLSRVGASGRPLSRSARPHGFHLPPATMRTTVSSSGGCRMRHRG